MEAKNLTRLTFHKNAEGQYHCPVLFKTFTDKSHIVAIRTTGNVFSYEALEQLNLKPRNWKELLTDEVFTRDDMITLQDPSHLEKFNIANFHHVKNDQRIEDEGKYIIFSELVCKNETTSCNMQSLSELKLIQLQD